MRTIQVSVETFAALWKAQQAGEATEDSILRRLLGVKGTQNARPKKDLGQAAGFVDPRYDVVLPPNFEIFRNHKGENHSARAHQGVWLLKDGRQFPELERTQHGDWRGQRECLGETGFFWTKKDIENRSPIYANNPRLCVGIGHCDER